MLLPSQRDGLHLTHACPAFRLRSAGPMLERWVQLAVEIAKWEAEEKERQRREDMRAARQQTGLPRPLMIRTGKAKTDGEAHSAALLPERVQWGCNTPRACGPAAAPVLAAAFKPGRAVTEQHAIDLRY